jgi:flavin reductase (DIM6/NTAB) family NADH-FMN oxidoreductase RutF
MAELTPQRFRDWMSGYPTGVAVVTATDRAGRPCGMTCSSLVSVALEPATLMVCLRTASATRAAVAGRGGFAVNLLDAHARDTAELFASAVPERFRAVAWDWSAGGLPRLTADAYAFAECVVSAQIGVGDHTIVLGTVADLAGGAGEPLLYGKRSYGRALLADSPLHR